MQDEASSDRPTRSAEATLMVCVECQRLWEVAEERWRMYRTDDEPPELAFYCPVCAEYEFG